MIRYALLLACYRLTSQGIQPLIPAVLLWRRRRGREGRDKLKERMGVAGRPRPDGRLAWVHAASLGDGRSLAPLFERLAVRGFQVLVTTREGDSTQTFASQLPAGAFHQLLPVDVPKYVGRFLDHWRPDLALLAGSELWPNVLIEISRRGQPVIAIDAYVSDRTFAWGRKARSSTAALMRHVDLCLARTDRDADRFVQLGATSVQAVGDLVFDRPVPGADPIAVGAFASRVGARPIWVAALVERDEVDLVVDAHRLLLSRYPDLVTVLVPRVAGGGPQIVERAASRKLTAGLYLPPAALPAKLPGLVVVEGPAHIGLFYRASDIAFVGHSMTAGGLSPVEAAKLGCAVLHGRSVDRFVEIYDALDAAKGSAVVADAISLAHVVGLLFEDGAKLRLMQRNASQTIDRLCGGTSRVMRAIEPHVVQMLVES